MQWISRHGRHRRARRRDGTWWCLRVTTSLPSGTTRCPARGAPEGNDVVAFWDDTLPRERRAAFSWQELLVAPMILLPFADPQMYVDRYAEPDKRATGLGAGVESWPVPYWTVDTSFAVMTLLLALRDAELGALFFGVFSGEAALRQRLGVPDRLQLLGAIAVGHPTGTDRRGRSAARPRRTADDVIHRSRWQHR